MMTVLFIADEKNLTTYSTRKNLTDEANGFNSKEKSVFLLC